MAKAFHGRFYRGTVHDFQFDVGFEVKYDDGDAEHMVARDVIKGSRAFTRRFATEAARVQIR